MAAFSAKYGRFFLLLIICFGPVSGTGETSKEDLSKLANATNHLALRLYKRLSNGSTKNIFFSPLSLATGFGMIFHGATDNTAKELRATLGYDVAELQTEKVSPCFKKLLREELTFGKFIRPNFTLSLANEVLVQSEGVELYPKYTKEVEDYFLGPVKEVDFAQDAEGIVVDINDWVKKKTNGKIEKLVDELEADTAMILLNAVYFKGKWETSFQTRSTKNKNFYNNGSQAKKIPFMNMKQSFRYTATNDAQVIELPYKGKHINMLIILPKQRNGLSAVEQNLTPEALSAFRKKMYKPKVELSLPRFKVEFEKELSEDFISLGAFDAFNGTLANFSGMANMSDPDSNGNLFLSKVVHKAAIEVNEEGSVAAAATGGFKGFGIQPVSLVQVQPIVFNAEHPFIFTIIDNRNGMMLFTGRVSEL